MTNQAYTRTLCSKGHLTTSYGDSKYNLESCKVCDSSFVWFNEVDNKNGSFDAAGYPIDGFIELEIATHDCCKKCGHLIECTYKIPSPFEKHRKGTLLKKSNRTCNKCKGEKTNALYSPRRQK